MSNQNTIQMIGRGVYTLQEASLYGNIPANKLSRWVFGTNNSASIIEPELKKDKLLSFRDLVQAMAINMARTEGIPLHKVRDAITFAKKEYRIAFPLAYNHNLILFGGDLHIEFPDKKIIQASGKGRNQSLIRQIVEPFKKYLHFCDKGVAIRYTPFSQDGIEITLDPEKQFGQPLVGDTGYRADVLADAYYCDKSAELVAAAYNVEVKDVLTAVSYIEGIRKAA